MTLRQADLDDRLLLTVIKLSEECFFDLIDVFNIHLFFFLLDLNELE